MDQETPAKQTRNRTSTLLNRAYAKEFALRVAQSQFGSRFTRVGSCFLDEFTEECERFLAAKVKRHPSKGKTLLSSFPRTGENS
jgi:hypothetical protein